MYRNKNATNFYRDKTYIGILKYCIFIRIGNAKFPVGIRWVEGFQQLNSEEKKNKRLSSPEKNLLYEKSDDFLRFGIKLI